MSTVVKGFSIRHVLSNEANGYPTLPDVLTGDILVELGSLDHNPTIIDLVRIQTPLALGDVAVTLIMVRVVDLFHLSLLPKI